MEVKKNWSYTVILELTQEEATWLRGVMQNPLHGESRLGEEPYDAEMRRRFFDAVTVEGL